MEKDGVYKIEEWKRSGLFRRYKWVQLTERIYLPFIYGWYDGGIFFNNEEDAIKAYNDLVEKDRKKNKQWTQIYP